MPRLPVGVDEVDRQQGGAGEAVRTGQPADPAPRGVAGDTHVGRSAPGHQQAVSPRGGVDGTDRRSRSGMHDPPVGVHAHGVHARGVQQQRVWTEVARGAVPGGLHSHLGDGAVASLAGQPLQAPGHIIGSGHRGDRCGTLLRGGVARLCRSLVRLGLRQVEQLRERGGHSTELLSVASDWDHGRLCAATAERRDCRFTTPWWYSIRRPGKADQS